MYVNSYVYIYIYVFMNACKYVRIYMCIEHVWSAYVHMYVHMYLCVYVCAHSELRQHVRH